MFTQYLPTIYQSIYTWTAVLRNSKYKYVLTYHKTGWTYYTFRLVNLNHLNNLTAELFRSLGCHSQMLNIQIFTNNTQTKHFKSWQQEFSPITLYHRQHYISCTLPAFLSSCTWTCQTINMIVLNLNNC